MIMMVPTYTLASAIQQSALINENIRQSSRSSPYSKPRRISASGEEPLSSQRLLADLTDVDGGHANAVHNVETENYNLSFFHWDPTIADIVRWEGVSFLLYYI